MSIRLAAEADIPAMVAIYGPYVRNTPYSFEYTAPDEQEFSRRLRDISRQYPWLVWEEQGQVLGYAYGSAPFERAAFSWCAEVSIYLDPRAHGRGIGSRLYRALEQLLARQGYQKVYALIVKENVPSLRFHQALGYRQIADFADCGFKMGGWHSIIWMEKRLDSVEFPSMFPVSYRSFVDNDRKLLAFLDNLSLS